MAGFERNTADQKLVVFAFDVVTGLGKTGDAGNLSLYVKELGGTVVQLTDTTATELDATNAPGYYEFDLAASEIDTAYTYVFPKSSTTTPNNVGVTQVQPFFTVPSNFTTSIAALPTATAGTIGGLATRDNLFSGVVSGSVNDVSPAANGFNGDPVLEATDDTLYAGMWLLFTSGNQIGAARKISAYTATTRSFSFTGTGDAADTPFPKIPASSDQFIIFGYHGT